MSLAPVSVDSQLVAACGLYCGACPSRLKGRCPGCKENAKATWCKVRSCNLEHGQSTCAECKEFADPRQCKKFNNPISKVIGFFFNSNRAACIELIRGTSLQEFAERMAADKKMSLPRR